MVLRQAQLNIREQRAIAAKKTNWILSSDSKSVLAAVAGKCPFLSVPFKITSRVLLPDVVSLVQEGYQHIEMSLAKATVYIRRLMNMT